MKISKKIRFVFDFVFYRYCRLYIDLLSPRGTPYEDGCFVYFMTLSFYIDVLFYLIGNVMPLDDELIEYFIYAGLALPLIGTIIGFVFSYMHKNYYKYLHEKFYEDYGEEDLAIPIIMTLAPIALFFYYFLS